MDMENATIAFGPIEESVSIDLDYHKHQSDINNRHSAPSHSAPEPTAHRHGAEKRKMSVSMGAKEKYKDCRLWLAAMHRNAPDAIGIAGLKYVLRPSENKCRRLCWIVVLGFAMSILALQILDRALYYSSFPMSVKTEIDHRVSEVVFPKVVICNLNTFVKDATEKNEAVNELLLAHQTSYFGLDALSNLSQKTLDEVRFMNTSQVLVDLAHQPQDMFIGIHFADEELSISNVTYVHTDYGLCYQLNDGLHGSRILATGHAGKSFGLSLILNAEQSKYYYGSFNQYAAGFLLQLLDQDEHPLVAEFGFAIGPGTENYISLQAREETNIKPPFGICGEKRLKYYRKYSRTKCELECLTDITVAHCGCRRPHMPGNSPVCDPLVNTVCAIDKILSAEQLHDLVNLCNCPIDCFSKTYQHSLSSAKYPSLFWADELAAHINSRSGTNASEHINETYFSNNIVAVDLFFMDISITRVNQQAAYSFFALLADIGGSMGLWLGGSLLTFYEVFDLCGYSFFSSRRNTANASRKT